MLSKAVSVAMKCVQEVEINVLMNGELPEGGALPWMM